MKPDELIHSTEDEDWPHTRGSTDKPLRVREACRRRMPLDGTDAQGLEHALTITERERDEATAERARYGDRVTARIATLEARVRQYQALAAAAAELSEVWGTDDQGLLYAKAGAVVAAVDELVEPVGTQS